MSFIYGQSSTNLAHFVKIGAVEVEIIGLTAINENKIKKIKRQQKISPPRPSFAQRCWANNPKFED